MRTRWQHLKAAFSCGIVSRFRVWAGLRRLPCEWASRKSQWRRRQWIGSGHRVGWRWRRDGSSECMMRRQPQHTGRTLICQIPFIRMACWFMRQAPLHMRFFARSSPMSCLPCWWRRPTGTMVLWPDCCCTRWPGQPSTKTVQLRPVPKPIQLKQTTSPKTAKKCFKGNYKPTMYFVLCIVYCVLCITILCCANNQIQIFSIQFNLFS